MLSVSILELYAVQFESLVNLPKRSNKRNVHIQNESELVNHKNTVSKDNNYHQQ